MPRYLPSRITIFNHRGEVPKDMATLFEYVESLLGRKTTKLEADIIIKLIEKQE